MQYFKLITLIFIMITPLTFADNEEIPIVEYHICSGISDRNILEDNLTTLIDKVEEYLESKNFQIIFDTGEESIFSCEFTIQDALATVRYYEQKNGEGIIDSREIFIRLSDKKISEVSPILSNDLPITFSTSQDGAHEILATFLLYALGEYDIAEENLLTIRESINNDNLHSIIDYYLGNIALINNDIDLALEYYNNKNWLPNTVFHTFYGTNLAWTLIQVGETEKAIKVLTDGVEQYEGFGHSQYVDLLVDRAQLYALTFDYTSAIADMDTAIDYAEANYYEKESISALYKQRGNIIMLIYEWNQALEDYTMAIELDPEYAEAYYRRGILLYTMVERENAIADFETYLELEPNGQFAETASQYIDSIQTELDALGG